MAAVQAMQYPLQDAKYMTVIGIMVALLMMTLSGTIHMGIVSRGGRDAWTLGGRDGWIF